MASASGKRALVTGAAGFIGSHVADACLVAGFVLVAWSGLRERRVPRPA